MTRDDLIARLAQLTADVASGSMAPQDAPPALRGLADAIPALVAGGPHRQGTAQTTEASGVGVLGAQNGSSGAPGPKGKAKARAAAAVRLVNEWRVAVDRPRSKATPERIRAIVARLSEGYTEQDIRRAISGVANSPFHMGENKRNRAYNDITLICRNGSKLEEYIELAGGFEDDPKIDQLREDVRLAMQKGDTDGYEKANAKLRRALGKTDR